MSYAFGAPIVRSRGTLWPGAVLVAGLLVCLVLPALAQAQPVPQEPPAIVQTFAVPNLPDEEGEANTPEPALLVQDVYGSETDQAWLDALLIEQGELDQRLLRAGLSMEEVDLVYALRAERCPATPSDQLSAQRLVAECRLRETLDVLAARQPE